MSHEQSAAESSSHGPETLKLLCPYLARLHRETSKSSTETVARWPILDEQWAHACSAVFCITITVVPDNENILCFTMLFFKLGTLISQQNNTVPLTNKGKKATIPVPAYIYPLTSLRWRTSFLKVVNEFPAIVSSLNISLITVEGMLTPSSSNTGSFVLQVFVVSKMHPGLPFFCKAARGYTNAFNTEIRRDNQRDRQNCIVGCSDCDWLQDKFQYSTFRTQVSKDWSERTTVGLQTTILCVFLI